MTGDMRRNRTFIEPFTRFEDEVSEDDRWLLTDAQTSGGLLLACAPDRLDGLRAGLGARHVLAAEIGLISMGEPGTLVVG